MSSLGLKFTWLDSEVNDDVAIRRTMATLEILVNGQPVMKVLDKKARTTRDFLISPLYPIGEWLAAHWWPLLEECEVPLRGAEAGNYWDRHSLRKAGEGFALPDLRIRPEGDWTWIEWETVTSQHQSVDFLGHGSARVPTAHVRQGLVDFVDAIVERLQAFGITETWLQKEWSAIQQTPQEEADFCRVASWLGLDPYELDESGVHAIEAAWQTIAAEIREDFLRATDVPRLVASRSWLQKGLREIEQNAAVDGRWRALRNQVNKVSLHEVPWQEGYQLAANLRTILNLGDQIPVSLEEIAGETIHFITAEKPPVEALEGLIGLTSGEALGCYTAKHRLDARRFVFARGLLDFIYGEPPRQQTLLTSALTEHQQRGRAFAAEFLAPRELLAPRLSSKEVGDEEIEDLADAFQVSAYVIRHQIQNHGLAGLNAC